MALKPIFSPCVTQRLRMPTVNNVAASSMATVTLTPGYRYRRLHLVYGGTTFTPTNMTGIRLYADNELIQSLSGTLRDMLNQFDKMPAASTYKDLVISFERIDMTDPDARYLTCINTGSKSKGVQSKSGIMNLRLEIDINSGASAPTLDIYADVMDVNVEQSRLMPRIDTYSENVAATGEFLHANSSRYVGDKLRPYVTRITLGDTSSNITALRLRRNNEDIVALPTAVLQYSQVAELRRAPQSGYVAFDTGDMGEYFNIIDPIHMSTFEVRSTHAATNASLPVIVESLGPCAS